MDNKKFLYIGIGALVFLVLIVSVILIAIPREDNSKKTNVLTIYNYGEDNTAYKQAIENFQSANKVKIDYKKKDIKEYTSNTINEIAAGKGPDIWLVPANYMPLFKDKLTPMPDNKLAVDKKTDLEVYRETYPEAISQDNILSDKIYGKPLAVDPLRLYLNSKIFSQVLHDFRISDQKNDLATDQLLSKGPSNWDEFLQIVKLTTQKNGDSIERSGAAIGRSEKISNANSILTLIMLQYGTKMTDDTFTNALFHTDQNNFGDISFPGTKALEFYSSFGSPSNENYTWNDSLGDDLHAFADGKTAMFFGYQSQEKDLTRIKPDLEYKVTNVPQVKETKNPANLIQYKTMVVPKSSKNADLAWNFILFATDEANTTRYCNTTKQDSARFETLGLNNQDPKTYKTWHNPNPEKTDTAFLEMIKQVNDGKNPQTAIEFAASQITTLLQKLKE